MIAKKASKIRVDSEVSPEEVRYFPRGVKEGKWWWCECLVGVGDAEEASVSTEEQGDSLIMSQQANNCNASDMAHLVSSTLELLVINVDGNAKVISSSFVPVSSSISWATKLISHHQSLDKIHILSLVPVPGHLSQCVHSDETDITPTQLHLTYICLESETPHSLNRGLAFVI